VREDQPHLLWDFARIRCPRPQVNGSCVIRVQQVGLDALQVALAADKPFDDLWPPSVDWHSIQAQAYPEEHCRPKRCSEASLGTHVDGDAVVLEAAHLASKISVATVRELDEKRLRLVLRDRHLPAVQAHFIKDHGLDLPHARSRRGAHRHHHHSGALPLQHLLFQVEGGRDEGVLVRPCAWVAHLRHHRGR
jgi:hypothetical protein